MALLATAGTWGARLGRSASPSSPTPFARKQLEQSRFALALEGLDLGGFNQRVVLRWSRLRSVGGGGGIFVRHPLHTRRGILVAVIGCCQPLLRAAAARGAEPDATGGRAPSSSTRPARRGPLDHNRQAAYVHVLADPVTSVLAIVALLGRAAEVYWLDPVVGIVGRGHRALVVGLLATRRGSCSTPTSTEGAKGGAVAAARRRRARRRRHVWRVVRPASP